MTWVAGHSWVLLLLSALAGFAFTWWWMVRKIRGRVPITKEVAAVAASSGAAGTSAAGAGVAAGAATLAGGAVAPELEMAQAPDGDAAIVNVAAPAADLDVDVDVPEADVDLPNADVPDVALPDVEAAVPAVDLDVPEAAVHLAGDETDADLSVSDVDAGAGSAATAAVPLVGTGVDGESDSAAELDAEAEGGSAAVDSDAAAEADIELGGTPEAEAMADPEAAFDGKPETAAAAAGLLGGTAAASYAVGSFGEGSVDPLPDGSMPVGFDVKGNADSMLYHSPESPWYARTKAEVWFRDEESAAAAGFARWDSRGRGTRGSAGAGGDAATLAAPSYAVGSFGEGSVDPLPDGSMPVGFDVKGNADSMLYHSPKSPWYARTKAEVWFRDEATAAAAGFKHWDPAKR
ncbi:MAG: hypothetical protein IPH27_09610 [Actinomycetales bacterium]|jgi:hypothetical protein|nr:hypothetical protein [Candidatus Phosphoribacter baldrii]MBK6955694.1 hypothetical protein [Candidatus Phosphoribacter baldrii]